MLMDARQKGWFIIFLLGSALALGLYAWLGWDKPDGLTGGSRVGLLYGIAGGLLIVFAMLLSALRGVPRWWWIGSRTAWLKGHIWLGLLSGVLILCHSGFRWGGLLERTLYVVFGLTLLTGILGLILQQFLPRMLTQRIASETPYEQMPHICQRMQDKADDLVKAIRLDVKIAPSSREQITEFYEQVVRPFLGGDSNRFSALADPEKRREVFAKILSLSGASARAQELSLIERLCLERQQLAEQERLHHWLYGWLYLHVPLSAAMLALGLAHVVMALYY